MEIKQKGKVPNFKGEGVAVWQNKTKDGKPYLSIDVLGGKNKGGMTLHAWLYEPRQPVRKPVDSEKGHSKAFYPEQYGDF